MLNEEASISGLPEVSEWIQEVDFTTGPKSSSTPQLGRMIKVPFYKERQWNKQQAKVFSYYGNGIGHRAPAISDSDAWTIALTHNATGH